MNFREGLEKFTNNIIPDLRDNFPRLSSLKNWEIADSETDPDAAARVKDRFLSEPQYQRLRSTTDQLPAEGLYEHTWLVGDKTKGTYHPHVFLVDRSGAGSDLFFIDPEHNVGRQNLFRPKISNLMAIKLADSYENSEISIIRFSAEGLTPDQLKLQQQFQVVRQLGDQDSLQILEAVPDNVLFHGAIQAHSAKLSARYTNDRKAADFLNGGTGSRALRGKIKANEAIVNRFITYLEEGKFALSKRFQSKK